MQATGMHTQYTTASQSSYQQRGTKAGRASRCALTQRPPPTSARTRGDPVTSESGGSSQDHVPHVNVPASVPTGHAVPRMK